MGNLDKMNVISTVYSYFTCSRISLWEKTVSSVLYIIYVISPIDLIPDIPFIGWIDDIGIGALLLAFYAWRVQNTDRSIEQEQTTPNDTFFDATPPPSLKAENQNINSKYKPRSLIEKR